MRSLPLTLISLPAAAMVIAGCGGTDVGQAGDPLTGPEEYYSYECNASVDFDVTSLISGGTPPYTCAIYDSFGRGTVPTDTTLSGCLLSGTSGSLDAPGYYGFIVRVTDNIGESVDVPVGCANGPCNNSGTSVTIAPDLALPLVTVAGEGYSWTVTLPDVDIPCTVGDCSACNGCISTRLMPGPLPMMALTTDLLCSAPGTVCLVKDTEAPDMCPDVVASTRVVTVKPHEPVRDDGGPAWETVTITVDYSGPDADTCGPKGFVCHTETLTSPE